MWPIPWLTLLVAAYVVWVVVAIGSILMQRRSPAATLAWIFAFIALPFVSGLYYIFFGPRRVHRRRLRYSIARKSLASQVTEYIRSSRCQGRPTLTADAEGLAKVVARLGQGDPTFATSVKILDTGDGYLDSLERALRAATHHVHCEYYIWEPDRVGTRIRDLLVEAARRGAVVRVLLDAVGARAAGPAFWAPLVEAGGEYRRFNPLRLSSPVTFSFANFRTHRKIVVVDGVTGFMGGKNMHDPVSATSSGSGAWRDMHTRIEGEPVRRLQRLFLENWTYAGGRFVLDMDSVKRYFPPAREARGKAVQILASGPDDDRYPIHAFYLAAISTARYRVWITTPYFVPDEPLEFAMRVAVLRGVEVQLIVPQVGDSRIVTAASRTYCEALGNAGVEVFEYGPPMLHAKTMVVDDTMATIGTANLDNRSFRLNFEVAAAFYDKDVIDEVAAHFVTDRQTARNFRKRKSDRVQAMLESIARLTSPVL